MHTCDRIILGFRVDCQWIRKRNLHRHNQVCGKKLNESVFQNVGLRYELFSGWKNMSWVAMLLLLEETENFLRQATSEFNFIRNLWLVLQQVDLDFDGFHVAAIFS